MAALLAFIALAPDGARPRPDLMANFWPQRDASGARNNLRQTLFACRRRIGDVLQIDGDIVRLDTARCGVDVHEFRRLCRLGTAETLQAAIDLYRGELLAGFDAGDVPFEEWLQRERGAYLRQAVDACAQLLSWQIAHDRDAEATRTAHRLIELEPLDEAGHRTLMRLYVKQGRTALALTQYRHCADLLRREIGVPPDPETSALYRGIVAEGRSADAPGPRAADPAAAGRRHRVLVVDDDDDMLARLSAILRASGYHVTAATSGGAAMQRLSSEAFDLVLADVMMPVMTGLQLLDRMRSRGISTPAILVTARQTVDVEREGLERGAQDFIRKPIQKDVLLLRVRNALGLPTAGRHRSGE